MRVIDSARGARPLPGILLALLMLPVAAPRAQDAPVPATTPAVPPMKPLINDVTTPEPAHAGRAVVDQDRRCVETLYQLELLVGRYKVFKEDASGRDRTWLDDRDRPAEIARLGVIRDSVCSNEQPMQGSQKRRAAELFQFLSPACREAREELERLARPDSRTSRNEMDRHRGENFRKICPDPPDAEIPTDLWLAERVRPARPR